MSGSIDPATGELITDEELDAQPETDGEWRRRRRAAGPFNLTTSTDFTDMRQRRQLPRFPWRARAAADRHLQRRRARQGPR
jgi:hypothetical protein